MGKTVFRKFSREEQKLMATWAVSCAERVLPLFDDAYPNDDRPRQAIKACRNWVRTGVFEMKVIRAASLGAHAAARFAKSYGDEAACLAARAAGQAVGTAHVTQHAYGGAFYALKAIAEANPDNADLKVVKELVWQGRRLPSHLREGIIGRLIVERRGRKLLIKIRKGDGF